MNSAPSFKRFKLQTGAACTFLIQFIVAVKALVPLQALLLPLQFLTLLFESLACAATSKFWSLFVPRLDPL